MTEGPVKIAEYADQILAVNADQILAVNAEQMLTDNGIEARVFDGGIALQVPRYDLYVKAGQVEEAKELLAEFEAADAGADEQDDDYPESDCEGGIE